MKYAIRKQIWNISIFGLYGIIIAINYFFISPVGAYIWSLGAILLIIAYSILDLNWITIDNKFYKIDKKLQYDLGYYDGQRKTLKLWKEAYDKQQAQKQRK